MVTQRARDATRPVFLCCRDFILDSVSLGFFCKLRGICRANSIYSHHRSPKLHINHVNANDRSLNRTRYLGNSTEVQFSPLLLTMTWVRLKLSDLVQNVSTSMLPMRNSLSDGSSKRSNFLGILKFIIQWQSFETNSAEVKVKLSTKDTVVDITKSDGITIDFGQSLTVFLYFFLCKLIDFTLVFGFYKVVFWQFLSIN